MRAIPVNEPNGVADLTGSGAGTWLSLGDLLARAAKAVPEGTNVARIYAHADVSYCMAPDVVAADPSIAPIILPAGQTIELYDAEQLRLIRVVDNLTSFTVQFFRA